MTPEPIAVRLRGRDWNTITMNLGNTVGSALESGTEHEAARVGDEILTVLDRQAPWGYGQFPVMDQEITLSLTRQQWTFLSDGIRASIPICEQTGDQQSAQFLREALAAISSQL